ncbi:MAG TPA: hypothetical protein VFV19_06790 [Candidatus Polarisedimenticolaceae bacterium]|nr:hypothetical protein [Candidatus Polarisedimenticolaceae bacterium]
MKTIVPLLLAVAATALAAKDTPRPPADKLPQLAASLAQKVAAKQLAAPDGSMVAASSILDAARATTCLKTIDSGDGWPASWLIVQDKNVPYDLVLRVALSQDGTSIEDPATIFLTARKAWDDDAFDAAYQLATGKKPPREKSRNVVLQSFTSKSVTDYVYTLPPAGKGAKGLLAQLPEGSYLRESAAIDLRDGNHHTVAVVLNHPRFVPADCGTPEGMKTGHRDEGGISLVLAGEKELEDSLDITELVKTATGASMLPKLKCAQGDAAPGAIDALVDAKFEGREPVRLLDFSGKLAECNLDGFPIVVGVKKEAGAFKVFAHQR